MDNQIERNFKELFANVSPRELENNRALGRQTEKLRQLILRLRKARLRVEPPQENKESSRSFYSAVGEYALHK